MRKRSRIIASVFCLTALFPFLLMNGCLEDDVTSDPSSAPVDSAVSTEDTSSTETEPVPETDPASETEAPASSEDAYTDPTVEPATEPLPGTVDWEAIQGEMQEHADRFISDNLTSFQFAVMDAGEIVVSGTAGKYDRQQSQPLTSETMYGVASCSKVAATAAVMRLVDQGKVVLDAPVTDYLPDFKMADPRYKDITVRMLMNHSSGLYGNTVADAWKLGTFGDTSAHDKFLERLSTQRLKSDPGEYSIYCNDGFTLMELICERVSGMSYADYLRQEIFEPLGMEHTFTPQDTFDTSQIAAIYSGDTKLPSLTTDPAQGGLFSTAEDLCRLGKAFTEAGGGVLSSDAAKATGNAEYLNGTWCEPGYSTMNYGLGWDAVDLYPFSEMGIKAMTKNGDVIYSGSQMIVLPEYNLVAAAVGSGSGNGVAKGFLIYSLLQILQEKGVIDSMPTKPGLNVTAGSVTDEIRSYAGTYIRGWGAYELSFVGDKLVKTAYPSGSKSDFTYIGNGHFKDDAGTDYWFFEQNGRQYQASRAWDNNTGLIDLPNVQIQGVKVEKNALDSETLSAWSKRAGKSYLLISEPYDSLGYVYPTYGLAIPGFQAKVVSDPSLAPFWRGVRFTGPYSAENAAEVPIVGSSNSVDINITVEDGTEILHMSCGLDYISAENLPKLDPNADITVSGTAKWFRTSSAQNLSYTIPEKCAVAVYSSDLTPVANTHVDGTNTVSAPSNAYVAFIGSGTFTPQ